MSFLDVKKARTVIPTRAPSFRRLAAALAVAGVLALGPATRAGVITTQLGAAGPGNFAVFGLGGTTVDATDISLTGPGTTIGNVGVASDGKLSLSGSSGPSIIGNVFLGNTATIDHPAEVQGTVFYNQDAFLGTGNSLDPTTATGAVKDAITAANFFAAQATSAAFTGITSITGTTTLVATQALNVLNLTDLKLSNGEILTLTGTAGQEFIINISGDFKLNADATGGKILLAGGLTTSDVVFNITGTGADVATSGGSSGGLPNAQINGIVLTLQRKIAFAPGLVNGEIIGGGASISLVSGSQVVTIQETPEPGTIVGALAGLGLVGVAKLLRNRRRAGLTPA
jgi:hypothetical protein